jgi:hypothetical protein
MSVSVSKTLLFGSGEIKFSALRSQFKEVSSGAISASELRRNTSTSATSPVVPDATENAAISTANNLALSQFRNTIKYYDQIQSGTDLNLNLYSTPTWNANLTKNILKRIYIQGTCGSNSISSYALTFDALVYNLSVIISGGVYGASGSGGNANGGNGGSATYLNSTGSVINLLTTNTAQVYGGGGGGAKGATGATGASGTCYTTSDYTTGKSCNSCPGCGSDQDLGCFSSDGCNCGKGGCSGSFRQNNCRAYNYYAVPGAPGGSGGTGGPGRGYDNFSGSLTGSAGSAGTTGGCPSYGADGAQGETGASGGEWGQNGNTSSDSNNTAGSPGRAVTGSNYSISVDSYTAAFKGSK